ncbi:MAG: hypothetical protein JKX82_02350 [Oleispira sp.]|nr:hypothetical protein [Oleispira sp.]
MKYYIKLVLIINLAFLSLTTHAEESDKFTQFKISSLQLSSSFSSYIYFQGDEKNRMRLLNAKSRGDQAISEIPDSEVELKRKWQQISDYVDDYQTHNFNGADMSLEGGWGILQGELSLIVSAYKSTSPNGVDDIQINLETILSRYMSFANSTTGGYGVSYSETPLEEQIYAMEQALLALAQADNKYQPLVKNWNYIQGTLLAYNSNVAPFVVLHTFDGMRKMIAEN